MNEFLNKLGSTRDELSEDERLSISNVITNINVNEVKEDDVICIEYDMSGSLNPQNARLIHNMFNDTFKNNKVIGIPKYVRFMTSNKEETIKSLYSIIEQLEKDGK